MRSAISTNIRWQELAHAIDSHQWTGDATTADPQENTRANGHGLNLRCLALHPVPSNERDESWEPYRGTRRGAAYCRGEM